MATEILLITDIPRLGKIFSRLNDEKSIRLRIASSLEQGGEEIIARKPDIIFVQTHLFGLSGDILLMHLKKQLGRRRSRFVLLAPPESIAPSILKKYHQHIDLRADDEDLYRMIRETVASGAAKQPVENPHVDSPDSSEKEPSGEEPNAMPDYPPTSAGSVESPQTVQEDIVESLPATYSPPSRLNVYSEFTGSFNDAAENLDRREKESSSFAAERKTSPARWKDSRLTSGKTSFLLWSIPVLAAAVAITFLQHRTPATTRDEAASNTISASTAKTAGTSIKKPAAPAALPPLANGTGNTTGNAPAKGINEEAAIKLRPVKTPDFIPKYGFDRKYGAEHPGWERYRGEVTEFRLFREGGTIKAIQVIDRGGEGVPESFMRGVLKQLARKPEMSVTSREKKDGYEIGRGRIAENIGVIYYRDADGGRLRGFSVVWD